MMMKNEGILKAIGAVLTAFILVACVTLAVIVKDNQERIKSLSERIEVLEKNESDFPTPKQPLQDGEITKKYMIDDDCMIEVWDAQFKTLRLYTVDFDEWELMKIGEVW
jgi:lipoprotein